MRLGNGSSPPVFGPGFEEIRPEPTRFWLRWAPRRWPGPAEPFLDLARIRLAGSGMRRGETRASLPAGTIDTVYLPPVHSGARSWRDEFLAVLAEAAFPTWIQLLPGETPPSVEAGFIVDPTAALLEGSLGVLETVAPEASVAWPLIAGLTDTPEIMDEGCRRLSVAGVSAVQGVVPLLSPGERRTMSEALDAAGYHALFHARAPRLIDLARTAVQHGLEPWLPRPTLVASGSKSRNRHLAEHLAILAEWWLLVGRPEGRAQALFRAARWVDDEARDITAVAREGNLGIVAWLEPACREEIERFSAGDTSAIAELADALRRAD